MVELLPSNFEPPKKHAEKYIWFISKLYSDSKNDRRYEEDSFINISAKKLHSAMGGNYIKYIREMETLGFIECDNRYIVGVKSKGFRLPEKYRDSTPKEITIKDETKFNKIADRMQDAIITEKPYDYLQQCLGKITIDEEKAYLFIDENFNELPKKKRKKFHKKNDKKPRPQTVNGLKQQKKIAVKKIANGIFRPSVDKNGRFHNTLTSLQRDLRQFIQYQGSPLVEIDIANCQPYLFNQLLTDYIAIHNTNSILPYDTRNTDVERYQELTSNGSFYRTLKDEFNSQQKLSEFKITTFAKIFFSRENPKYVYQEKKLFQKNYPTIYEAIKYYKRNNYEELANLLQKAESKIIIKKVIPRLRALGIFALTIHDSILTTIENAETVNKIMTEELTNSVGVIPTLKIK